MSKLVLASESQYKKALLQRLPIDFITHAPYIDESPLENEKPFDMVKRLAIAKAQTLATEYPDALIISTDQCSVNNNIILGKPGNLENAVIQLTQLSNQNIIFYTGLAVLNTKTQNIQADIIPYTVKFKPLSQEQIIRYLNKEKPFDCAGSFKSEGLGISLCQALHGDDPTALIGLPLIRLVSMLALENIMIP